MIGINDRQFLPAAAILLLSFLVLVLPGCQPLSEEDYNLLNLTVQYFGNGAETGTVPVDSGRYSSGETIQIAGNTGGLTRSEYSFESWNTADDGSGTAYNVGDFFTFAESDLNLYANWSDTVFSVIFRPNCPSYTGYMANQRIGMGETVSLDSCAYSRAGWSFSGWSDLATGAVDYTDGADFTMGSSDVTLYAVWDQIFHVLEFEKNGSNVSGYMSTPQAVGEGATITLDTCGFVREGWTFIGWAESAIGSVVYLDGASYTMGTADDVLYAVWTENRTISFDGNAVDVTGSMEAIEVGEGLSASLPACSLIRNGYSFSGWSTSPAGEAVYADSGVITGGSTDVVLYATWLPSWAVVGTASFTPGIVTGGMSPYTSFAVGDDGTPYISYSEFDGNNSFTITAFNGSAWQPITSESNITRHQDLEIGPNGYPYLTYENGDAVGDSIWTGYHDGTSWNLIDTGSSPRAAASIDMEFDSSGNPYFVYRDRMFRGNPDTYYAPTVVRNTSGIWELVGSPQFEDDIVYSINLAMDSNDVPYVAYSYDGYAVVKRFDGSDWAALPSSDLLSLHNRNVSMCIGSDDAVYLAFSSGGRVVVRKYNGSWQNVGSGDLGSSSDSIDMILDAGDTPVVAYSDYAYDKLHVKTLMDGEWVDIRNSDIYSGDVSTIMLEQDGNGRLFVAFVDVDFGGGMTVMTLPDGE